jgi:16S rRNA (adenine1518-N6/adenine1519-N6)-dimethyltransferase
MAIHRPSELIPFLDSLQVSPKKSLSQNFLIDGNVVRNILSAADVTTGDLVVEIGPGPGALTEQLLKAGATVVAIEKDRRMAAALQRLQTEDQRLTVIEADALEFPFETLAKQGKWKLIANLPYNISTPILTCLLSKHTLFSSLTVMLQKEVADRCVAKEGSKQNNSLALFVQFHSTPKICFEIPPTCFYPRPKVNSSVVSFSLHEPQKIACPAQFFEMVRKAFGKRRKMVRSSLSELYRPEQIEKALLALEIDPQVRPEQLSLARFLRLFHNLEHSQ